MLSLRLDDNGGVVTALHFDPADQTTTVTLGQDVTDVMERCAAKRAAEEPLGMRRTATFREVAEIPCALVEILRVQGQDILNDPEALRRFLNDPAFAAFRTSRGRV